MQLEFKRQYLDEYDLKPIVKAVWNLFDDYNYKKAISQSYLDLIFQHRVSDKIDVSKSHKKINKTQSVVEKREKVVNYLDGFDKKLESLLETLTPDELRVYKYSILSREHDKVVRDAICKTDKTYYLIKKSCYVKFALRFDLVDGFTKNVFATISLFD